MQVLHSRMQPPVIVSDTYTQKITCKLNVYNRLDTILSLAFLLPLPFCPCVWEYYCVYSFVCVCVLFVGNATGPYFPWVWGSAGFSLASCKQFRKNNDRPLYWLVCSGRQAVLTAVHTPSATTMTEIWTKRSVRQGSCAYLLNWNQCGQIPWSVESC